ncbi:MAG: hypothetical protein ACRCV9_03065 [Burkholderiaceae bacterium]
MADWFDENTAEPEKPNHDLDSEAKRKELKKLLTWYYFEKDRQSENRLQMATDADFYDNIQWDAEDAATLRERGQMPLVFNEIAPMIDWLIGTERRTRVDWKVLPRTEDDVELADVKTKVLKYVADINKSAYHRSRAFADAGKVGLGWIDDGVRDDPTQDPLYSRYEDWRCVLHDSLAYDLDMSDARYVFRWRWVDVDIARVMYPDRIDAINKAAQEFGGTDADIGNDDDLDGSLSASLGSGYRTVGDEGPFAGATRKRIKLIECQYRAPAPVKIVAEGELKGAYVNEHDAVLMDKIAKGGCAIHEKVSMRMHIAVFTERDLLYCAPSPYRFNGFTLTPVWGYRRSRDRLPYGAIRRVRDLQQDLNKRASKALHALNTRQVIAETGAVKDIAEAREEIQRPDGWVDIAPGRQFRVESGSEMARGQMEMMQLDAASIQRGTGISNENLGRQTNAVSGKAIEARQLQGSVVTTEFFDNLRLAVQLQGEKQLSMTEQFYSDEKVIRLTGNKGALEWVRINQPEQQPDGSIRHINDISGSMADFVVSEADFAGSMRQTMFDALNSLASRLPPEVSLRLLTIAFEYSDLPNKDEVAEQIRKITGERDPDKPMDEEEAAQMQQQMQAQAEAMEMQRQQAQTALAEQQAKVRELNAKAAKLEAEVQAAAQAGQGQDTGTSDEQMALHKEMQDVALKLQAEAAAEIDRLSEALRKAQAELTNRTLQIRTDADVKLEMAQIDRVARERVAQIQATSTAQIDALGNLITQMQAKFDQQAKDFAAKLDAKTKEPSPAPVAPAAPVAAPAPSEPIQIHVHVDSDKPTPNKSVVFEHGADGKVRSAKVVDVPAPAAKTDKNLRKAEK